MYMHCKYSGQKPLFLPHPQILKPLFLPFLYFRKICSRHHCHHFHLRFCWVLSIGWREMIFCQKFGKRGVKHETFLMWNRVNSFWGKPSDFCLVKFFWGQSLFLPCFWKNGSLFLPPPTQGRRGAFLARIFTDVYMSKFTAELAFCISTSPLYSKFYQFQSKLVKNCGLMVINLQWVNTSKLWCQGI